MDKTVILIGLLWIYYNIGGLATTNILRLTSGNTLPVLSAKCVCDKCGVKISALFQLPIISYIICRGKCKNCFSKIPVYPLILEISIFSGMSFISALLSFSPKGVALSYVFYEVIRVFVVAISGKRESEFIKQYVIAVFSMLPFLFLTLIVSGLYGMV